MSPSPAYESSGANVVAPELTAVAAEPCREGGDARGINYIAVSALPRSFERVTEWVEIVATAHPHMLGLRAVVDCTPIAPDHALPSVEYLEGLAKALAPLMRAASCTQCAIVVPSRPFLWRARLFESMTSGSRIRFRAFESVPDALAWLGESVGIAY